MPRPLLLIVCTALLAGAEPGSLHRIELEKPPGLDHARFEIWVPASISASAPARAVICSPLYQADTRIFELESWRAVATRQRAVMIRHDLRATVAGVKGRLPIGREAIAALDAARARLEVPGLATAPFVFTGLSQGGAQTTRFAVLESARTVCAIPFHGAALAEIAPGDAVESVPMLLVLGSQDDLTMRVALDLPQLLRRQPLWAALLQPGVPHQDLGDQGFICTWLEAMLERRIASDGGLRPLVRSEGREGWLRWNRRFLVESVELTPPKDVFASSSGPHWLPGPELAQAWSDACLTGRSGELEAAEELAFTAIPAPATLAIDGDLGEWGELPQALAWPAQVLPDGLGWQGPADGSARFAVAVSPTHLVLAVAVVDDRVEAQGKAPWHQDGIEWRLDARPARLRMANAGRGEGGDWLLVAVGPDGAGRTWVNGGLPAGTEVAAALRPGGYAVEIAVPHAALDRAQGGPWRRLRMNLSIGDLDAGERTQLNWRPDWRTEQTRIGSGTIARP